MAVTVQIFVVLLALSCSHAFPRTGAVSRLVGGRDSIPGEFPHQVSLRLVEEDDRFICGGAIIAETWILTAAQCVINRAQNGIAAVAGSINLESGGTRHQSIRHIIHPQFDSATMGFSVAIVQVQTPFAFNAFVQPIALGSTLVGAGVGAVFSGWGGQGRDGPPFPNILQAANFTTLTNPDCRSRHSADDAGNVTDEKLCIYATGSGLCFGDAGGATVSGNAVISIAVWGRTPCGEDPPDVQMRVSPVRGWILSYTEST